MSIMFLYVDFFILKKELFWGIVVIIFLFSIKLSFIISMGFWHILLINIYDIETFTEKEKVIPYCICYKIGKNWDYLYYDEKFDIVIRFLNVLITLSKNDIEIYSHNINFDGFVLIEVLTKKKIRFEWYIRDLNIYWIKIYFLNIEIKIRCSYKIIPLSINNIGKMINKNKNLFPYKFSCLNNLHYIGSVPNISYFEDISIEEYNEYIKMHKIFDFKKISIEYCFNDLKILNNVLVNIIHIVKKYNKNIIKTSYSFSSISFKLFKSFFDKHKICEYNINISEYEYIKKSYFGGRCEVFGNPKENEIIHYFDFSGMYSQCMKNKFPIGIPKFETHNLDINKIGLHSVKIKSDMIYPILPIHYNKKLLFPNGIFNGVYTDKELIFFVENGGKILEHYSSYVFNEEDYVFDDYVKEFIKIRDKGIYYKIFGKAMNNGLYGSFALNVDNFETIIIFNEDELNSYLENTNVISWKKINECIVVKIEKNNLSKKFLDKKKKWKSDDKRNLIYASYISSYARIKLYNGIKQIIKNKGRIYYCDTDSFFAGFKEKNLGKDMGEIKWSDIFEDAIFISPKFYYTKNSINEEMRLKGVKNFNDFDFKKIKDMFYSNNHEIVFKNQLNFSKKEYMLIQKYLEKKIKISSYDKRIFSKDKKDTIPIKI